MEKSRTKFVDCHLTVSIDKLASNPQLYIIALMGERQAIQQWQLLDHCFQLYSTWTCCDWISFYLPHWISGIIFCTLLWTDSNYVPNPTRLQSSSTKLWEHKISIGSSPCSNTIQFYLMSLNWKICSSGLLHNESLRNYHYSLCNRPEEHSSHLFHGGSLKSHFYKMVQNINNVNLSKISHYIRKLYLKLSGM
jgi:hypothetical protein